MTLDLAPSAPAVAMPAIDTDTVYLARQPILDAKQELAGYELLFRSAVTNAVEIPDDVEATSAVIAHAFVDMGLDRVVGPLDGFLNVDVDFLHSDLIESLPPRRIVLELLERRLVDSHTAERCAELRARGFRIAVKNFIGNFDTLETLGPSIDLVKIDFLRLDPLLVPEIVRMLKPLKVTLVAEKVETAAQFDQARLLGFPLFEGYHFARPQVLTSRRAQPAYVALTRLLSLAVRDAEVKDIEAEFKHHPNLAVNLLRLVNSAALTRGQTITSLRHALVLLGRRQLRIWLQLLIYTSDRGNRALSSPLLQLAATRGKLMEILAEHMPGVGRDGSESAFMTGILSLMDALLQSPLTEIVGPLNLPAPVRDALLKRSGPIGTLLKLAASVEQADGSEVAAVLDVLPGVDRTALLDAQLQAMQWANELAAAA
ncbi:MAG: EAL domain-containing protein [Burkholderiales bacterium]